MPRSHWIALSVTVVRKHGSLKPLPQTILFINYQHHHFLGEVTLHFLGPFKCYVSGFPGIFDTPRPRNANIIYLHLYTIFDQRRYVNRMLGYTNIKSMTNYCVISRIAIVGLLRVGMRLSMNALIIS